MRPTTLILCVTFGLLALAGVWWLPRPSATQDLRGARGTAKVSRSPGQATEPGNPNSQAGNRGTGPVQPAVSSPASPIFDPATAPVSVRAVVDIRVQPFDRLQKARLLRKDLKHEELNALYAFLQERHLEDDGQSGHAYKNELMEALISQTVPATDLCEFLGKLYHDQDQNVVIRDYALQHVAALYERLQEPLPWPIAELQTQRKTLQGLLWEATTETDSSIAGTALLALNRLSESDNSLDRQRIGQTALTLAQDTNAGELARVTALQVCARQEVKEALPLLVQTIEKEADTSLRISAIGALGLLGGQAEIEFLQQIGEGDDSRLKPAVTLALRRVQQRISRL